MDSLTFINALNDSPITFIPDLSKYDWNMGAGFEAISIYGEIRAFNTWNDANAWRLSVILDGEQVSGSYNSLYGQD